jgi:hypothetical protein
VIPNPGSIEEKILKAVSETIENLAFEEVVIQDITPYAPPPEEDPVAAFAIFERVVQTSTKDTEEPFWAFLSILDPRIGDVAFWLSRRLAHSFAEALHSLPAEELASELIYDNLGELLNTLSGRLMAYILPPDQGFMLDIPRTGCGQVPILPTRSRLIKFLVGPEYFIVIIPESYFSLNPALS